jgi:hypothetical protein
MAQPTVNQYRTHAPGTRSVARAMGDRPTVPTDHERSAPGTAPRAQNSRSAAPGPATAPASLTPPPPSTAAVNLARPHPDASVPRRPLPTTEAGARRPGAKFGAAADGWDAYNTWLDRVRQSPPPSRQAVIAKSLYSLSSYKSWADKARGAFDPVGVAGVVAPVTGGGKVIK